MDDSLLTSRELAALLVLAGLAAFLLSRSNRGDVLKSVASALASFLQLKVLLLFAIYIAWIFTATTAAEWIGLWSSELLKPTILWLALSGLALLVRLDDAIKKPGFFRGAVMKTLGVIAAVEFLSALKSFPLWIELPAQALAFIFTGVAVLTETESQNAFARKLATGYLVVFGLSTLLWSAAHLLENWSSLEIGSIVREFFLPIWLTPIALIFVYTFAVVAAYQSAFRLMQFWKKSGSLVMQKLALILRANGRLGTLRHLAGLRAQRVARTESFREAWREIGRIRDEERQRVEEEAASKRRLIEYAGVAGTDEYGRQLDQREFTETRKALKFLSTCQMRHFRNRGHRYRADLLPIVEPHFELDGLPADHGVEMQVSPDGQSWYATRQTITGWWFAIGAAGPPPDEWVYDGPTPPEGFPCEEEWDRFGGGQASVNWD